MSNVQFKETLLMFVGLQVCAFSIVFTCPADYSLDLDLLSLG